MPKGSGDHWPEDYERGRPGWPADAVDVAGLVKEHAVVDLGAGTGKLTRLLAPRFDRVIAVEPADPMRRILEALCPTVEAIAGAAHAIPIATASVDAIFAAQAFHWFTDDRSVAEMTRILRPRGAVVLMFNTPGGPWQPSSEDAEDFLTEIGPDEVAYIPLDLGAPDYTSSEPPLPEPLFEPLRVVRFSNPQTLDRDGLVSFYASMGWLADLHDDVRLPILERVRSLLGANEYRRNWETHVYWTRLAG